MLGVSWPSGLAYRTQVLVLAAECGFESRPWHLCPWARHLTIIASLHPGVKWVHVRQSWYCLNRMAARTASSESCKSAGRTSLPIGPPSRSSTTRSARTRNIKSSTTGAQTILLAEDNDFRFCSLVPPTGVCVGCYFLLQQLLAMVGWNASKRFMQCIVVPHMKDHVDAQVAGISSVRIYAILRTHPGVSAVDHKFTQIESNVAIVSQHKTLDLITLFFLYNFHNLWG